MNKSLVNRAINFFWLMFRFNLLFIASNVVLIGAMLFLVLHWFTLPVYLLGALLLVPSLQALFLAIRKRDELVRCSPTQLYISCYKEEFKGALMFAWIYIAVALLLVGSYIGLWVVPRELTFVPFYMLLGIIFYIHFVFGLLIRAKFVINIIGTWRLGLYCISRHPLKALFILGGTLILGALANTFHQLIIIGIVPMGVYLLTVSSEKMFDNIATILKVDKIKLENE